MCCCNFGSFNKPFAWIHNKPWLVGLGGSCKCPYKGQRLTIQGSFTAPVLAEFTQRCVPDPVTVFGRNPNSGEHVARFSGVYPLPLTGKMASGSRAAKDGSCPIMPLSRRLASLDELTDCVAETRAFHDDPEWVGELADSLEFREIIRYRFAKPGHINVLEARSYNRWIKWCAKQFGTCRLLGIFDSRVLLGASAKGRSSSPALTHVLRGKLPYVLGCQLYPAGLRVYSSKNRSDGPSRWQSVPAPSKAPPPLWLSDLQRGSFWRFDVAVAASSVPKVASRWLRLLLLLGGDIERNPGLPRPVPRGTLESGFATSTQNKMQEAFGAFTAWWLAALCLTPEQALCKAESAALALHAFGLHLNMRRVTSECPPRVSQPADPRLAAGHKNGSWLSLESAGQSFLNNSCKLPLL